jgi:hypothetical protein
MATPKAEKPSFTSVRMIHPSQNNPNSSATNDNTIRMALNVLRRRKILLCSFIRLSMASSLHWLCGVAASAALAQASGACALLPSEAHQQDL